MQKLKNSGLNAIYRKLTEWQNRFMTKKTVGHITATRTYCSAFYFKERCFKTLVMFRMIPDDT